jgi:catechol 2,3-dioxygenase-like lactoylglutathione lyase family enzyme
MLSRFHSAVVDVADFDAGVRDYGRMLGRAPGFAGTAPETERQSAFFGAANMLLEIRGPLPGDSASDAGLSGIRLECDDIERFSLAADASDAAASILPSSNHILESSAAAESLSWICAEVDRASSRQIPIELISEQAGPWPTGAEWAADATAEAGVDPQSAFTALDHVVVMSAEIESTRNFYADGLGIRLALDRSFEHRGVRLIFFRIGGVTIEIGGRLGAEPSPDSRDRFGGLAWQAPDLAAAHARLSREGFDVSEMREGHKPGTRVCTVRDPVHDVPTLLIQPVS